MRAIDSPSWINGWTSIRVEELHDGLTAGRHPDFRQPAVHVVEMNAAPGQYTVGFIVKDLDGNSYETYTTLTVTK